MWTKHLNRADTTRWRHQMGNIFRVTGQWPVNFPHKGQWRGALMFCFICAWINGWVNNREVGDLRRHRVHSDVTIMKENYNNMIIRSGNQRQPVDYFHKDVAVLRCLEFSLLLDWISCWANIRIACDLRRFYEHVMSLQYLDGNIIVMKRNQPINDICRWIW